MSNEKTSFKSNFGAKLKLARGDLGWNQEVFAKELGISRDTLSRYERGELSPSLEVFSRILEQLSVLELRAEDLLFEQKSRDIKTDLIKSWGWAKGFSFVSGGAFRMGATRKDILLLTEKMIESLPDSSRFESVVSEIESYLYELEDETSQEQIVEFEIRVPIAKHTASLIPEFPDEQTQVEKIFDKYMKEKTKVESLEKELFKLSRSERSTSVNQNISGNEHTIAGNDITINKK